MFSKASEKVKFFFATIPLSKVYIDDNGKMKTVPVRDQNGMYRFYDARIAYNTVLNILHSCKTKKEMRDVIQRRARNGSGMFAAIESKLKRLDKLNDEDALGFKNQMFRSLHSYKYTFLTISKTKDSDGDVMYNLYDMSYE